jgi:Gpi18-like mannosyltransferase
MLGLIIFLPDSGYDKYFWVTWAKYLRQHGLFEAYNNPEINYHPILIYLIDAFSFLHWRTIDYTSINWLKVPTALFDWGIIFIALKLMQKHKVNLQWGLLLAFNPAFWYNTVIWGQFDSIWVFFTLLSFYLADSGKFYYSTLAFLLAINTKLFALFFLPFLIVMWSRLKPDTNLSKTKFHFYQEDSIGAIVVKYILFQLLVLLPFLGNTQYTIAQIIQRSTEYYNSVSRNAYNVWYYFFDNPVTTADTNLLAPAIIAVGLSFIVLLYFQYKNKTSVWNIAALASLIFFLFLTRMHERYAYAAMIFSFIAFINSPLSFRRGAGGEVKNSPLSIGGANKVPLSFGERDLGSGALTPSPLRWRSRWLSGGVGGYLLISVAYLLNLEAVMQTLNKSLGFNINYNSILFNPKLIATLYVISLILLLYNTLNTRKLPSP